MVLIYIPRVEANSAAITLLPDFSTTVLPWFPLGPAEPSLVALQVEDAYVCKAFA